MVVPPLIEPEATLLLLLRRSPDWWDAKVLGGGGGRRRLLLCWILMMMVVGRFLLQSLRGTSKHLDYVLEVGCISLNKRGWVWVGIRSEAGFWGERRGWNLNDAIVAVAAAAHTSGVCAAIIAVWRIYGGWVAWVLSVLRF